MNLFKLVATVGLDTSEYEKGIKDTAEKGKSLGASLGHSMAAGAKIVAAGVGAAASAVAGVTTMALKSYAETEQLIGGIETLYGNKYANIQEYAEAIGKTEDEAASSWSKMQKREQSVLDNAAKAYKTAGMSANEYMETVSGFAASLTSSLGEYEWQASSYADMIITDMSDNANKMGTDIEMIKNAYAGFAKGNFTMLDNLKLGYGGTQSEMERLLRKAEELEGFAEGTLDMSKFSDIADAINIIQTEMGITGTTAKEAEHTISGSIQSLKGAFNNLVSGVGDETADLDKLVGDFVDSTVIVAENVGPRIEKILEGIGYLGESLAPLIAEGLAAAVEHAPEFITAGLNILSTLGSALVNNADTLIDSAFSVLQTLLDGLNENPQAIVDSAFSIINSLAEGFVDNAPQLATSAIELIGSLAIGLAESLPDLIEKIPGWIEEMATEFWNNRDKFIQIGKDLVNAIGEGIWQLWDDFTGWWGELINSITGDVNTVQFQAEVVAPGSYLQGGEIPNQATTTTKPKAGSPASGWKPNYRQRSIDGSHADGLDYVPFDGYIAELHQGERVLTAEENKNSGGIGVVNITVNGAKYDDEYQLAEAISEALQNLKDRKDEVYA